MLVTNAIPLMGVDCLKLDIYNCNQFKHFNS